MHHFTVFPFRQHALNYIFSYDFLRVYDGDSLHDEFTGDNGMLPKDITSTGESVFLNFVSDDSTAGKGFIIQYDLGKLNIITLNFVANIQITLLYACSQYSIL